MRFELRSLASIGALLALGLLAGCAGDAAPAEDTPPPTSGATPSPSAAAEEPDPSADLPENCGDRLVNPNEPIPAAVFGECVIAAHMLANTVHQVTTGGSSESESWWQQEPLQAYGIVAVNGEEAQVVHGPDDTWVLGGGVWTRAVAGSSDFAEMQADTIRQLFQLADPRVGMALWGSGEDYVKADIAAEEVNGVSTYRYTGLPESPIPGATIDSFEVWLDDDYRPIRIVSTGTGTAMGITETVTTQSDYFDWGEPFDIPTTPEEAEDSNLRDSSQL